MTTKSKMPYRPADFCGVIDNAIAKLWSKGVKPTWIKLSPSAHQFLVDELNLRDDKPGRARVIYEIKGLKVEIDEGCPAGGGYMGGEDDCHEKP